MVGRKNSVYIKTITGRKNIIHIRSYITEALETDQITEQDIHNYSLFTGVVLQRHDQANLLQMKLVFELVILLLNLINIYINKYICIILLVNGLASDFKLLFFPLEDRKVFYFLKTRSHAHCVVLKF
jgi:hypothetical protein